MGRWGGWIKQIALLLVALVAGCGDTGGGSSSSGQPFVFQARARLNLIAQPVTGSNSISVADPSSRSVNADPTLNITAILIDPQGNPFRNQRITLEAEFADVTIIPANTPENEPLACLPQANNGNATRCTNRGAAITDDFGVAQVTLIAGLTLGRMRVTAEAPAPLNTSSAISVDITSQGFLGGVDLAIIPTSVTFVNPFVNPDTPDDPNNPMTVFNALGGKPPFTWRNANPSLGRLDLQFIPGTTIANQARYTLIGAIPPDATTGSGSASTDTVTLTDSTGASVPATVNIIFAECKLNTDTTTVTFDAALGGETFRIDVSDGVPPFSVTDTFPGTLTPTSPQTTCDTSNQNCTLLFTLVTPARAVNPDVISIRDSRGCTANIELTVGLCGNGRIDAGEECDTFTFPQNLDTCTEVLGVPATGRLLCTDECKIDDSKCQEVTPAP